MILDIDLCGGWRAAVVTDLLPQARRLIRFDTRPTDIFNEQSADRQGIVADELGLQPESRTARKKPVERIAFYAFLQ